MALSGVRYFEVALLLALQCLGGGAAFDFVLTNDSISAAYGQTIAAKYNGNQAIIRSNALQQIRSRIVAHLLGSHSLDDSIVFNWTKAPDESVAYNITVLTVTNASRLSVPNVPQTGSLDGTFGGFQVLFDCLQAVDELQRASVSFIFRINSASSPVERRWDVIFMRNCTSVTVPTTPTPVTSTTLPTTTPALSPAVGKTPSKPSDTPSKPSDTPSKPSDTPSKPSNAPTRTGRPGRITMTTLQPPAKKQSSSNDKTKLIIIIIVLAIVITVCIIGLVVLEVRCKKYWRSNSARDSRRTTMFDDVLIDVADLEIHTELGKGAFGIVYEGKYKGAKVAVKTIKGRQGTDEDKVFKFLEEALVMKKFNHPNVLDLVGVCFQASVPPQIVVPFMELGDLLGFLRQHDANLHPSAKPLRLDQLVNFGLQVANGMEYLADLNFVHRDLACRNCMMGSDHCVKVGDFGLARDMHEEIYYRVQSEFMLPVRWMAPESLHHQKFSLETDVWSYGILLWELMSSGKIPYPGIQNQDIPRFLENGDRLPKPGDCPEELYEVMRSCWLDNPRMRPTFKDIKHQFRNYDISTYENIMSQPLYENLYSSGVVRTSTAVLSVTNMTSDGSTSNGTVTFTSGANGPAVQFSTQSGQQKAAEAAAEAAEAAAEAAEAAAEAVVEMPAEVQHTSV